MTTDYQWMFWDRENGWVRGIGNKRPSVWQILTRTNWRKVTGRNYCSCGVSRFGWDKVNKRLNLWPISIWF